MAVFKCKMCGGQLDINDETVVECEYCGTKQTVPTFDNDKKINLFTRANRLRINNEFDKAISVFESIVAEFPEEAEAYWGLVLCKYGIEYVDDPATGKKIPTCHRTSFDSVMKDSNFEMVLEYADSVARRVYRDEAKIFEEIRKGIIEVSSKEEPYDIFICYKETDENGERTLDSVLAQDIYTELTDKGYKVFFARITLEDKLGQEYEPYIFSALNSSKVMLVVGTDYEYFNAVWVKNEWSRFLKLIANGQKKSLIPCYKNIDAYDMPDEFAKLQAQDLGKVGATQDLLRGIEKIIPLKSKSTVVTQIVQQGPVQNSYDPLLKRAFMFLEDKKWNNAIEYCEKVLDIDPENAEAYLGKLMAELNVRNKKYLKNCKLPFDDMDNYKKALRFGDEELKNLLKGSTKHIKDRNNEQFDEKIYNEATELMSNSTASSYEEAERLFKIISDYKDSNELAKKCSELKGIAISIRPKVKCFINDLNNAEAFEKERNCRLVEVDEKILELNNKKNELLNLSNIQGKSIQEIVEVNHILSENKERIAELKKTRNSLGLFAGKQKKEIDAEISAVEKECRTLDEKISELKKKTKGYTSAEGLQADLTSLSQNLVELNNQKRELELRQIKTKEEMIAEMMKTEEGKIVVAHYRKLEKKKKNCPENIVLFGYYADEIIEWRILATEKDKALLISKDAIDYMRYNEKRADVTWETCTLRRWLNSDFINAAFDDEEKEQILITKVEAHKNPKWSTEQGKATKDKIFLLSVKEAEQYFKDQFDRKCKLSKNAAKKRNDPYSSDEKGYWWLRTIGKEPDHTAIVEWRGNIRDDGWVFSAGVRPALWIKLKS